MNCQQFQEVLPYIIESGGNAEQEEHLRSCPACAELVQDLRYIAEQAKLLLPMHDPNSRVWNNIEQSLHQEGLHPTQEGRLSPPRGYTKNYSTAIETKSWTPLGWVMALAAMAIFATVLTNYKPHLPPAPVTAQNSGAQSAQLESDDQQVISQMSQEDAGVRRAYEDGLKEANAYISDAEHALKQDPQDAAAQEQLLEAHQQKEMLYQMATMRSLP